MGVVADELPHLIHQEHDSVVRAPAFEVLLHPFGEILDRESEVVLRSVDQLFY